MDLPSIIIILIKLTLIQSIKNTLNMVGKLLIIVILYDIRM